MVYCTSPPHTHIYKKIKGPYAEGSKINLMPINKRGPYLEITKRALKNLVKLFKGPPPQM